MITKHLSLAAFTALLFTVVGCNPQSAVSQQSEQQTAAQTEPDGDAENREPHVVSEKPRFLKSDMQFNVDVGSTSAGGLTSDGKTLWISAQSARDDTLLQYTTEGEFLRQIALGRAGNISGGLAYDGHQVLVLDYRTKYSGGGAIFRLGDNETLVRVVDFPADLHNTFGLTSLGDSLYFGHSPTVLSSATIYEVKSDASIHQTAKMPFYVRGMASDGQSFWLSSGDKIYRTDREFTVLESFDCPIKLGELAWADGTLWGLANNQVHRMKFVEQSDSKSESVPTP